MMTTRPRIALKSILIFLFFVLLDISCARGLHKDTEFVMGTFVEVICEDERAKDLVFTEFKRLEGIFSLYDEDSELSRLNREGYLVVSEELFELLRKAQEFYEVTDGAFDVTVTPLSLLWKKSINSEMLPAEEEVESALGLTGFEYVYLDQKTRSVRLLKTGLKIDLSSIAKGYAVDRAVEKLRQSGISSAIVNGGGDLYCLGENHRSLWRVGIRDPRSDKHLLQRLKLKNEAVATSGDYEQYFVFQNKRYSHIIDPKSGYPADSGIASATVVASDTMTADALATALVVLGREKAREILKNFKGVRAKLVDRSGKIYDL